MNPHAFTFGAKSKNSRQLKSSKCLKTSKHPKTSKYLKNPNRVGYLSAVLNVLFKRRSSSNTERGSIMPIALVLIMVTMVLAGTISHVVQGLQRRAQIQSATDLSALAGANRLHNGVGDPCELVFETLKRNDVTSQSGSCLVDGTDVVVTATYRFLAKNTVIISRAGPSPGN